MTNIAPNSPRNLDGWLAFGWMATAICWLVALVFMALFDLGRSLVEMDADSWVLWLLFGGGSAAIIATVCIVSATFGLKEMTPLRIGLAIIPPFALAIAIALTAYFFVNWRT